MGTQIVIGAQWGDEGKGKIVDERAAEADLVVRYQGGSNAGHTVVVDGTKYVLHLIPSGVLQSNTVCLIGPGMVVNLRELLEEIEELEKLGIDHRQRLKIARRAHVLFPFHQAADRAKEQRRGSARIGTTGKGIGPAYVDRVSRTGLRICDLDDRLRLEDHCLARLEAFGLESGARAQDSAKQIAAEYYDYYQQLKGLLVYSPEFLQTAEKQGKQILFEGAQGAMLDLDFGTYPFVTSSHPTVGGAGIGSGFPAAKIQTVTGIVKAYTTRVGEGPFPAELVGETGDLLRKQGGEYGATTGRARRCGWLDIPQLNFSVMLNGFTELVLTKLDVLSGHSEIGVVTGYLSGGEPLAAYPATVGELEAVDVELETVPGWDADISDCSQFDQLPRAAQDYVRFIEKKVGVPISCISVGPGRKQLIKL